jgi:sterol desaturase/sphingolipid hydroxylase (fatty acid hydroxylase superfamily)
MDATIKPHNKGTKQLFKSPLLEKLTRTHIAVPVTIFAVYSSVLLYWSCKNTSLSWGTSVLMFAVGFIFFTWVEYQVHRHVFHMGTFTKWREKTQYLIHGVHHEFPKDKERLAMPPLLSITIGTLLLLLSRLVMGDLAFSFVPGFMIGYAYYLLVHYMVHAHQPPNNFFKVLWLNHSIHHYKKGDAVFGVTSPFWDYLYGTTLKK